MAKERIILLNSGGKDSYAALRVLSVEYDVISVFISSGFDSDNKALKTAKKMAEIFDSEFRHINCGFLKQAYSKTLNRDRLPHQQLVYFAVAANLASAMGIEKIASGHGSNTFVDNFYDRLNDVLAMTSLSSSLTAVLPLDGIATGRIVDLYKDSTIVDDFVTCVYEPPCGTCNSCVARQMFDDWRNG